MIGSWIWLVIGGAAAAAFAALPWRHLGRGPTRPWSFRPLTGVMTFVLALLAGACVTGILAHLMDVDLQAAGIIDYLPLMIGAWGSQLGVVAFLPLIRRVCEPQASPQDRQMPRRGVVCPDRRRSRLYAIGVGVVGLLLFWPMTQCVGYLGGMAQEWLTGDAPSEVAHGTLQLLIDAAPGLASWIAVICIAIIPGIVEEVLYRGLLQTSLHRLQPFGHATQWHAVILTSLIFTAMHVGAVDVHALAALLVLSLGFGWAYARTGRLTASITMHIGFNTGNLLLAVPWI